MNLSYFSLCGKIFEKYRILVGIVITIAHDSRPSINYLMLVYSKLLHEIIVLPLINLAIIYKVIATGTSFMLSMQTLLVVKSNKKNNNNTLIASEYKK